MRYEASCTQLSGQEREKPDAYSPTVTWSELVAEQIGSSFHRAVPLWQAIKFWDQLLWNTTFTF